MTYQSKALARVNNSKWIIPSCFFYMCILFVLGVVLVFVRGFEGITAKWAFTIGADVICMAICVSLGYSCFRLHKDPTGYTRIFTTLITLDSMALFLDETAWIVQGLERFRTINQIVNVLFYTNGVIFIYFFWRYVTFTLDLKSSKMRFINNIMNLLLIPGVLACFVNFFYPLYFSVDANGVYERSSTWIFSQGYLAAGLLAVLVGLITSKVHFKIKLVTLTFVLIPLINQVLTGFTFGISTQYAAMLVSIVLIYGVLFADRAKRLATTSKELALATRIQSDMLPNVFPPFPDRKEFEIIASMDPAKEVGGDFYDFFLVDDDHLGLVIADVSGKGVPAALFMMASKIVIASNAKMGKTPAKVLTDANRAICSNNKEEMFVTVWLGILEISTGILKAANAGHEYPIIKKHDGSFEIYKDKHGFVVGGMDGVEYSDYEIKLEKGDKLFVYTDGIPEATNADQRAYGLERLINTLNENKEKNIEDILKGVEASIKGFVKEAPQFDDITMLCFEYKGGSNNDN